MMTKQKRKHVVVPENVPIEGKSLVADVSKKDTKMEKIRISTLGFWQNLSSLRYAHSTLYRDSAITYQRVIT